MLETIAAYRLVSTLTTLFCYFISVNTDFKQDIPHT